MSGNTVLIANQRLGDIVFPRCDPKEPTKIFAPITLGAAAAKRIDKDQWEQLKKNPMVKIWLDKKIIAEVKTEKNILVQEYSSADLPIPEILKTPEELGDDSLGREKARVVRKRRGSISISE